MITVYAWAVMLLSLPLMIAASRIEFKRLLLGVLAVFAVGQALSSGAPTFAILVVVRIVVACAHAIFWSIASVMATRLVSTRHASVALGMIATGTSIAMIFGMPWGARSASPRMAQLSASLGRFALWPSTLLSSCLRYRRASPSPSASCRRSCAIAAFRPCMR
ncbi:MAG: MFS transporter, partial [Collinsella intestinalis]